MNNVKIFFYDKPFIKTLPHHWRCEDINFYEYYTDYDTIEIYATSKHLKNLSNDKDIIKRAYTLIMLFNGSQIIGNKSFFYTLTIDSIYKNDTQISECFDNIDENPFIHNQTQLKMFKYKFDEGLFCLAKKDFIIKTILLFYGLLKDPSKSNLNQNILNWSTLYKIYDTIKSIYNIRKLVAQELYRKINTFTGACNNMSILGLHSRHGLTNNTPPSNIVSLEESIDIILKLTDYFLNKYLKEKNYIRYFK